MFILIARIIKYGWLGFWRDKSLTIASVFIMVLMVFLISFLLLLPPSLDFVISRLQEKVDISVYFERDSIESEILQLSEQIETFPGVRRVEYISQEKALQKFIEWHKDDPEIMESLQEVGDSPLPASLNIIAESPAHYAQVSSFLVKSPFNELIKKIDYHQRKPVIERLFSLTSSIRTGAVIFVLIFALIGAVIIFNQIRLSIYTSSKEIKIMRLVGASNWFATGPFLAQGLLVGLASLLVCVLLFGPVLFLLSPKLALLFPGLNVFALFKDNFLKILLVQAGSALGLAVLASSIATRKYLKA